MNWCMHSHSNFNAHHIYGKPICGIESNFLSLEREVPDVISAHAQIVHSFAKPVLAACNGVAVGAHSAKQSRPRNVMVLMASS